MRVIVGDEANPCGDIDVGENADTFRLWLAKEHMRAGEALLAGQAQTRTSLEARGVALVGWANSALLLITAAWLTAPERWQRFSAASVGIGLAVAVATVLWGLRGRRWSPATHAPGELISGPTELQYRELAAASYGSSAALNEVRLDATARALRWAMVLFTLTPIWASLGAIVALAAR